MSFEGLASRERPSAATEPFTDEPEPVSPEQLIAEQVTRLLDSAATMQKALAMPIDQRAMRMTGSGSVEAHLVMMKRIGDRQEGDVIAMREQADLMSRGMNTLLKHQAPPPRFRAAVEQLLAMSAQALQRSMAEDRKVAETTPGYESWGTKTERLHVQAYQSLLDRIDQGSS